MADIKPLDTATMAVAASALRAQQARMRVIAENLANADSTAATVMAAASGGVISAIETPL